MRFLGRHRRTLVSAALAAAAALALAPFVPAARAAPAAPKAAANVRPTLPFHLADQFTVGGEGAWGGIEFDAATRRIFVARATTLQVVDADGRKLVSELPCPDGPHGLVLAPDARRGFLASLSDTSLLVFDLDKGTAVRTLKLGGTGVGPLVYDVATKRVDVLDPGGTITSIDATTLETAVSRNIGARPQAAVSDGAGALYVALTDVDAVAVLDARTLLERARWPLESGAGPAALAYDAKEHRLFAAGKGMYLAVLEPDRGRVVARVPLGGGVENMLFDPERRLVATLGRGGASATVWQESADQYTMLAMVGTNAGARSFALDPAKHVLYTASARLARSGKAPPGQRAPIAVVPGSFTIFILQP
jgi:DNA-binding beta-propeller fold protein YncE